MMYYILYVSAPGNYLVVSIFTVIYNCLFTCYKQLVNNKPIE